IKQKQLKLKRLIRFLFTYKIILFIGISIFISMFIFLVVFELGYLYAYKKGGFEWD
ncbi:MAG: NADH-quinone oxidoreductase subunit A, partial [Bacteroidetes bacterium]|nr:NADH-quinone oxidoreductase subunit A [Bacteroidota bacterium]